MDQRAVPARAMCAAADLYLTLRESCAAQEWVESVLQDVAEKGTKGLLDQAVMHRGRLYVAQGRVAEGLAQLLKGKSAFDSMGFVSYQPKFRALLAEAYGKAGQVEKGLSLLAEAWELGDRTGESWHDAEAHRIEGDLLLLQGDEGGAEASYQQAIAVARQQQAKFWELRATTSLSRLLQQQGKREEARRMLAEICGWFTEGFDTADLQEAKALLDELS